MATVVAGNTVKEDLVFGYDTNYGIADNDTSTRFYPGMPTENLLNVAGSDAEIERSGGNYPFYSVNITSAIQSRWSTGNNQLTISYEGKRDYVGGGSGGGNDGYPVFYVYFTDWSWSSTVSITSYNWTPGKNTFTMPNPSGKSVYVAVYHMNSGNRGTSYSRKHSLEFNPIKTPFINGSRSSTQALIDLKKATTLDISTTSFSSTGQPEFDGTNDYIQNNSYTKHQQNTGTLEVVVRPTIVSGNRYVAGVGGTTTYGASRTIRINSGTFGLITYGSATQDWGGVATATANQYQHVVATWSGTSLQMYVNNVFYSATRTGVVSPLGTNLTVGRPPWSAGSYYAGSVDIFKQYSQVLSPQQVEQNYNVYKNRFNI